MGKRFCLSHVDFSEVKSSLLDQQDTSDSVCAEKPAALGVCGSSTSADGTEKYCLYVMASRGMIIFCRLWPGA